MLMPVDHRAAARPGRVHRLQPARPGRGAEIRDRALPAAQRRTARARWSGS